MVLTSCKFCYQETFYVFIYGEKVYIFSYTDVLHANVFSPFMIRKKIYRFFCIYDFFVDPTHNVNCGVGKILRRLKE